MLLNRRPATATLLFLVAFAAWFVADRYVDVGFYRRTVSETAERGLSLSILLALIAVEGASLVRSWRAGAVEWSVIATALVLLLLAEAGWRFIIAPLPLNGFKLAALGMDVGTPIVALLGVVAAIGEWRGPQKNRDKHATAAA